MGSKKIGLYFGTFNPVHIGHLVIANHFAEFTPLDEVWFVVTPHNPFKKKKGLLEDVQRFEMVRLATENYPKLKVSRVEFDLPQPNYTVTTLTKLGKDYPDLDFALIMGEDNLNQLHKWKDINSILKRHTVYVYPRISKGSSGPELQDHPKIQFVDAPLMELSSTFIRKAIRAGKNIAPMMPERAWAYLKTKSFYR